jgi:hypothetical protein
MLRLCTQRVLNVKVRYKHCHNNKRHCMVELIILEVHGNNKIEEILS